MSFSIDSEAAPNDAKWGFCQMKYGLCSISHKLSAMSEIWAMLVYPEVIYSMTIVSHFLY